MPQLEFMDCPTCGKRMVTTSPICRHCGQSPQDAARLNRRSARTSDIPDYADEDERSDSQAHMASETGGYNPDDDYFDYEEFLENEALRPNPLGRTRVKLWVWITAWILIFATLLPFILMWL